MESFLIAVVVMAIAALSNWLQRRAQGAEEQPPPPPPRPGPRGTNPPPPIAHRPQPATPPTIETSLERELRRLLGGEPTPAPPPPPVATARPAQAPPRSAPPPIVARESSGPGTVPPVVAVPAAASAASSTRLLDTTAPAKVAMGHLPPLGVRKKAARTRQGAGSQASVFAGHSLIASIRRDPSAARQAVIASVVLGPPKAISPSADF